MMKPTLALILLAALSACGNVAMTPTEVVATETAEAIDENPAPDSAASTGAAGTGAAAAVPN